MNNTDVKLINCNRSASIEGRTGNNDNPAIFTNPLQETIKLNIGDSVSIERAFINEIGAGNQQTIEFKGQNRKVKQADATETSVHTTPTYTNVEFGNIYNIKSTTYTPDYRLGHYRSIRTTLVTDDVEIRDNLSALIIGYYITANEYPQYVQQPRRWLQIFDPVDADDDEIGNSSVYTSGDGLENGFCYHTINPWCFSRNDWIKRYDAFALPAPIFIYKQKVDNSRYTLFVKNTVSYTPDIVGSADQYPSENVDGVFSECTYYRLREKINIEIEKGFNSPSSIANQITNQLTKVTKDEPFDILDATDYIRTLTQIIETPTYKPINSQNYYYCKKANYESYIAGNTNQAACNWIATMAYIGVKRPEIFEKGREMAEKIKPASVLSRTDGTELLPSFGDSIWKGFQIILDIDAGGVPTENVMDEYIVTNIEYNEENLKTIRAYLDTQHLYEEIWKDIQDVMPAYKDFPAEPIPEMNRDIARFFHINPYTTDTMITPHNTKFGDDGYIQNADVGTVPHSTIPIFFAYDDSQKDKYIPPETFPTDSDGIYSYGFAQPYRWVSNVPGVNDKFYVILRTDLMLGIPHQLFNETANTTIKAGRRIGHDFHATAFSTCIITPHAGNANCDIGTYNIVDYGGGVGVLKIGQPDTTVFMQNVANTNVIDISPYLTQTYIGANTPLVSFDEVSNRFNISKLHTANNVGNDLEAGSSAATINNKSTYPPISLVQRAIVPPQINTDGGDTVYKINPRPSQYGYSPTFLPYNIKNQAYRTSVYPETADTLHANPTQGYNTQYYKANNINIENYKIFDAHGGIYIESWGANKEEWDGSLWDILGYTYEQLHAPLSKSNVLTTRITNDNVNKLNRVTTNAQIVATDTKAYVTNNFGANLYLTALPFTKNILDWTTVQTNAGPAHHAFTLAANTGHPLPYTPEVVVKTDSIVIEAEGLPKAVLKPYYTIRSSLLEEFSAIGGDPTGSNLPIMGIVDKYSAQNDYFLGNPTDLVFTCTKATTIADITTSIHDPDGTFANVNNTSAVIYKVVRNINRQTNIVQQILENKSKKEQTEILEEL